MEENRHKIERTAEGRVCPECDRLLPADSFHQDNRFTGERAKICRECFGAEPPSDEVRGLITIAIDPETDPAVALDAGRRLLRETFPKPVHARRWKAHSNEFSIGLAKRLYHERLLAERLAKRDPGGSPPVAMTHPVNIETVKAKWLIASLIVAVSECEAEGDHDWTRLRHHLGNAVAESALDGRSEVSLNFEVSYGLDPFEVGEAKKKAAREAREDVDLELDERRELTEKAEDAALLSGGGAFDPTSGGKVVPFSVDDPAEALAGLIAEVSRESKVPAPKIALFLEYEAAEDKASFADEWDLKLRQIQNSITYTRRKLTRAIRSGMVETLLRLVKRLERAERRIKAARSDGAEERSKSEFTRQLLAGLLPSKKILRRPYAFADAKPIEKSKPRPEIQQRVDIGQRAEDAPSKKERRTA